MNIGTANFVKTTFCFGFITPVDGSNDISVHFVAVEHSGLSHLAEEQEVSFEFQDDAHGRKAVNLQTV